MKILLVNPKLIVQRNDPMTTGVVYMPIGLVSLSSVLDAKGYEHNVLDCFGEGINNTRLDNEFLIIGLSNEEIIQKIKNDVPDIVFIYCNQLINHKSVVEIADLLKKNFKNIHSVAIENTQAVTAYNIEKVSDELLNSGFDTVLAGDPEIVVLRFLKFLENNEVASELPNGLYSSKYFSPGRYVIEDLEDMPTPSWHRIPLESYWGLRFAHGPQSAYRYLPLHTSRGCPYPCKFCVIPSTTLRKWKSKSPTKVVNEIKYLQEKYGVSEFHIEDLDPTVNDKRTKEICELIILSGLKINWKIVAGTKVETIKSVKTIRLMAESGCTYISISPESGSPRVLKSMAKPFNIERARLIISACNKFNIKTQACFVIGFPGEEDSDRLLTYKLVIDLAKRGLDEIAVFIVSPVPGSDIYGSLTGYTNLSQLNFTPTWRDDYSTLVKFRLKLYLTFVGLKIIYHPVKILIQCKNFLLKNFETKMEMVPFKFLSYKYREFKVSK